MRRTELLKGGMAVALSLAMTLALPGVAFAEESTTAATNGNTTVEDVTIQNPTVTTETKNGNHTFSGTDGTITTEIDNASNYTVSLPKLITLADTSSATTEYKDFYIDCNLAPDLTLSCTVEDVTLHSAQNTATNHTNTISCVPYNAAKNASCNAAINGKTLTLTPIADAAAGINTLATGAHLVEQIKLSTNNAIYAGHWKGILNFHVTIGGTDESPR